MTLENPETINEFVLKFKNEKGIKNIIPLKPQTKIPDVSDYDYYFDNVYDGKYGDNQNIGVILGATNDNLVGIDNDAGELGEPILDRIFNTWKNKTGKKGDQRFIRLTKLPDYNRLTATKNNKQIEIFFRKRQFVLPPSIHPDTKKRYEIINDLPIQTLTPDEFRYVIEMLSNDGWTLNKSDETKKDFSLQGGVKIGNIHNTLMSYGRSFLNKTNPSWEVFKAAMIAWSATNEGDDYNDRPRQFEKDLEDIWHYYQNDLENGKLKTIDDTKKISKGKVIIDETTAIIIKELQLVTVNESQKTLLYNSKIYSESLAEARIKARTEEIIENCTTNDRNEVINKIKAKTGKDLGLFDNDPKKITLDNGVLNLETLELAPHSPDNLTCVLLPVEFTKPVIEINDNTIFEDIEKNIEGTLFYNFLKTSFTVNGEFRKKDFETVLEIMASVMIKRNIDEKAFMFLGAGNNGKSVLMDYIKSIVGNENISNIPLQDLANDRFMGAELAGKLVNIFTDLESDEMKHTGKVKAITSGEEMHVQEKHKKPFVLKPFCKLMFSCNRFPRIADQSQGFFRRWIIVKWDRDFSKEDNIRDPLLKEKLVSNTQEKNLVFSCLVYLARKLNNTGKFTHSKEWKKTQQAWNKNADPLDDFVNTWTKPDEENESKRIMFSNYRNVMISKGETPLGMGQFSKLFSQYYEDDVIRDKDGNKVERVWIGVKCIPFTLDEVEED